MDERIEMIRAVTDGRFKYIRNYMPHLPWFHHQTRQYPSTQPTYEVWHKLTCIGKLSKDAAVYMARSKPREQLFDLDSDPYELRNLANDSGMQATLERFRGELHAWQDEIVDLGFMPESEWHLMEMSGRTQPRHTLVRSQPSAYPMKGSGSV